MRIHLVSRFPMALGAVVLDTAQSARMQLDTDEDIRGRVLAAKSMVTSASGAIGGPLLGWMSEFTGAGKPHRAGKRAPGTTGRRTRPGPRNYPLADDRPPAVMLLA